MSRNIKFRAWNAIDKSYVDWHTLKGMPIFLSKLLQGRERHYSLEQFTGLTDKNGVEIYEGDILSEPVSPVGGKDGGYLYKPREIKWLVGGQGHILYAPYAASEVIGNIHENPELLK